MTNVAHLINNYFKIKLLWTVSILVAIITACTATIPPMVLAQHNRRTPVVEAVEKVSPAVVNVNSEFEVQKQTNPFAGRGMDPLFDNFFRDFFDPGMQQRYKQTSLGSGVIIDGKRGLILTNAHVIVKTGTISVVLKDERQFKAQIVGADPDSDLAVLHIDTKEPLPSIEMGNSDDLMIGETVIAIGNPFGFSNTVTTGVVSALNRSVRTEDRFYHDFIQTDASINPGNSGGPLLNINGELIGINTAIYAKAQGIGFAIPINKAKRIISDLIKYGEVIQAWIGLGVQNIDENLRNYFDHAQKHGVLITRVENESPALKSGLTPGDILVSIDSTPIDSVSDYKSTIKGYAAGQTMKLKIWRKNKEIETKVKTKKFPDYLAMQLASNLLGIDVNDIDTQTRRQFRIRAKQGVVITQINRQSYLAKIGVRPGDVIRQLGDIQITSVKDFKKAIIKNRHKNSIVILVQRGGQGYYITVNL